MNTINNFFEYHVNKYPGNPMMLEKIGDKWITTTYSGIREKVHQFSAGLITMGLQKGDRVSLISEARNAWAISELGILYAGAANVPLSVKLMEDSDLKFRITHSESKMVIVSGGQARKIDSIKNELEGVEKYIYLDERKEYGPKDIFYGDVLEMGKKYLEENRSDFDRIWQSVEEDELANICYTSGTTADPKGIMLTHKNYIVNIKQGLSLVTIPTWYCTLLILPWDHSFAHTCGIYAVIASGASIASVQAGANTMETLKNIPVNIREIKPHFLLSVPTLAKNFRKNIEKGIHEKGPVIEGLFRHALKTAYKYNRLGFDRGKGWRIILKPYLRLFDMILFKKVRQGFGGNLKFFVGGGALLDLELQKFFYAIGMPMYQGYGLTEASPVISSNAAHKHKMGSSGILAEDLELKICDDDGNSLPAVEKGEIIIRGGNVMKGYWKNEKTTNETLRDGWLHTGDLGYMDKDGFLYVLGRFKSLLISDDGEKYSPEGIEEAFETSKYIDQAMLFNNQNPYTVLLVYPNKENLKRTLREHEIDPSSTEAYIKALQLIDTEINEYRANGKFSEKFPQRWLPAAIGLLPEGFTEENRMLNSTMKMVRPKITEVYSELIGFLYTPAAKSIQNERNLNTISKLLS